MRETLTNPWDIPNPITKIIKEAKDMFYNLDTSLIDLDDPEKNLWFLKNSDPEQRK